MKDRAGRRARRSPSDQRARHGDVDELDEVVNAAARLLEARPRSIAEVRRRLTASGYQPPLVEAALTRLVELAYLDDEAFARSWAESRDRAHPRGERALRSELLTKGVDRAVVDVVLAQRDERHGTTQDLDGTAQARTVSGERERASADDAAALRLLERHERALTRESDPLKRRQQAYALLARNGFDPETARDAAGSFAANLAGEGLVAGERDDDERSAGISDV